VECGVTEGAVGAVRQGVMRAGCVVRMSRIEDDREEGIEAGGHRGMRWG